MLEHQELKNIHAVENGVFGNNENISVAKQDFEHSAVSAKRIYEQRKALVDNIFKQIGMEHYMYITNILEQKCFGHLNKEDAAHHIMHRVLNGTIIDPKSTDDKFIYDKHDKTLYVILSYLEDIYDVDKAVKIINGISVDY